jgi:hypothetical protein
MSEHYVVSMAMPKALLVEMQKPCQNGDSPQKALFFSDNLTLRLPLVTGALQLALYAPSQH